MRRKRIEEPEGSPAAIITADIELRNSVPVCRTDEDYLETMWGKVQWLTDLQERYDCPIFDGGDLFDKSVKKNPSLVLLSRAIATFRGRYYTVPGNHDLPGKSLANYAGSAMAVLEQAGAVDAQSLFVQGDTIDVTELGSEQKTIRMDGRDRIRIHRFPWGVPLERVDCYDGCLHAILLHAMVYDRVKPFPGCEGYEAGEILDLFDNADLIVCGHHHQTFTRSKGKTILVNPGSLMRNDADQADHRPCVFLWYPDGDFPRVRQVFVPIQPGVVSREHLDERQDRENRLDAFVERLGAQDITGVDFEANLQQTIDSGVAPGVADKIWTYYEGK